MFVLTACSTVSHCSYNVLIQLSISSNEVINFLVLQSPASYKIFNPSSTFELGHNFLISIKVLPIQPAFVAKGFIVFSDKSFWLKNVLMAGAGLYHHTGVPNIISSYLLKSTLIAWIFGKWLLASLFCSSSTTLL